MRARMYICDDCGREDAFTSYKKARAADWAVSKDYKRCYCPNCAPDHRVGRAFYAQSDCSELPAGFEQLKIDG